jgi:hypothetical protein
MVSCSPDFLTFSLTTYYFPHFRLLPLCSTLKC